MNKIIAIVPIRHFSSRINGKNYQNIGNHPLYTYILNTLEQSPEIGKIIVETDSPVIQNGCMERISNKIWQKVMIIDRPNFLKGEHISVNQIIENIINNELFPESQIFMQTHVTNPLLSLNTINSAVNEFRDLLSTNQYDSLFSVTKHQTRLYNKDHTPINHSLTELNRTQDLDYVYEDNSCFYLFTEDSFRNNHGNRIGKNPYFFQIKSKIESIDIDWPEDLQIARLYLEQQNEQRQHDQIISKKRVLITGVNGGIGTATALKFKSEDWEIIGTDIHQKQNPILDKEHTLLTYISADLSNHKSEISKIIHNCGNRLDAVVNIAAIQKVKSLEDTTLSDWNLIFNCNILSPCNIITSSIPLLLNSQLQTPAIVNISSIHSIQTSSNIGAYAVSKAALSGLTRNLAIELGPKGIRVNAVCPGAIDTPMLRDSLKRDNPDLGGDILVQKMGEKHIMGKVGKPEDIANVIYFLSDSKQSEFIHGANIIADGGCTIKLSSE